MTHRQIETSREIRLWVGQIATIVVMAMAVPEVRNAVVSKAKSTKETIKNKFRK